MPQGRRIFSITITLAAVLAAILVLCCSQPVTEGVVSGISACVTVVIPSLFLFMVISSFIACSPAGRILSLPFSFFTERCLALPRSVGCVVLMSAIGGYPIGAKLISALLDRREISPADAQRMLCFCCNAGPSFVVTAIGIGVFGSAQLGCLLLMAQLLSALLIGVLFSFGHSRRPRKTEAVPAAPFSAAFVQAVQGSISALLTICGYVILFSGIMSLLRYSGLFDTLSTWLSRWLPIPEPYFYALMNGLLEVTGGTLSVAQLPLNTTAVLLAAFFLSFSGLSVIFQVKSILASYPLRWGPFYLSRFLHGALTAGLTFMLLRIFPGVAPALAHTPPTARFDQNTPLLSVCLVGMSILLLLGLEGRKTS